MKFHFSFSTFSNLTNPISDVLEKKPAVRQHQYNHDSKNKASCFCNGIDIEKGYFELLIDKSSNLVMPKTMPL